VTYVRRLIDPNWTPLLITPPFPEYTSGHSVQSGAAAQVLTDLFGPVPLPTGRTNAEGSPRARSGRSSTLPTRPRSRGSTVESTFAPRASAAWSRGSASVSASALWPAAGRGSAGCSVTVERRA
jgi:hypothetical protein